MENYNDPNFNPGGRIDTLDPRDYPWQEIGRALPPFNWEKGYDAETKIASAIGDPSFKLKAKDQNGSGSCGGQAWSYQGAAHKAIARKVFDERSAKYLYSQTFMPPMGSDGRTNAKLYCSQGIGAEALTPSYENGYAPSEAFMERSADITPEARESAKNDVGLSFSLVTGTINDYAQALAANDGIIFLIRGSNNGTWGSLKPKPPVIGEMTWAHWIWNAKAFLKNGIKTIKFLNSWGWNVGEDGWQELDEEYFTAKTGMGPAIPYGWTHLFNPNPATVFHHNFKINLHFGDENDEVQALQTALQVDGVFPAGIKPTHYYGDITRQAVLKFQIKYAIPNASSPYGRDVGPLTRAQLNKLFG